MNLASDDVHKFRVCHCIGCGCNDLAACINTQTGSPCHWKRLDNNAGLGVCSNCPLQTLERWDAGDREPAAPLNQAAGALVDAGEEEDSAEPDYSMVEGMTVSVDVSTGEHDACNRMFATVTGSQEDGNGRTLLAELDSANFEFPQPAKAQECHQIHIYEKDGVFQASRQNLGRFAAEEDSVVVGVDTTRQGAIAELCNQEPAEAQVPDDVIATIWRAAMTVACNALIKRQNDLNDEDGPIEILDEQGECIKAVKAWLHIDDVYLHGVRAMLAAPNPPQAAKESAEPPE